MITNDHKLYKIRVDGDDVAIVHGYLTPDEVKALEARCAAVEVECYIEEQNFPVGLEAVLEMQDYNAAQDIKSILERREQNR